MFTGIVEEVGSIIFIRKNGENGDISIKCSKVLDGTKIGDSISVDGVCLTVTGIESGSFTADVSYETLSKTTLGSYSPNTKVNLERALTLSTRLGGHLVLGHVDSVGTILRMTKRGSSIELDIGDFESVKKYIANKGSICVNGISLTVSNLDSSRFSVAVIPHTFNETSLRYKKPGDKINLEVDVVARYIETLLQNSSKDNNIANKIYQMY
ncbi:MAG: riboflavin synthase [Calditerrivibrio sp.]|nr:riboflavin synthase [Calditerrivibrio sp.]MCA1932154.1 riboflavin synthase [Calditerrivibrio sp.]MCA1980137.1 riboflavin synthase [Calditerrivibrio sp.]